MSAAQLRAVPAPLAVDLAAAREERRQQLTIVTAENFAAVQEPGADPIVGTADAALIVEGGDTMLYGDGGASKTTLALDLACHLAAGDPWLGMSVPHAVQVLVLENEGPRAPFRAKLRRKLAGWAGSPLQERLSILEDPWATVSFAEKDSRAKLAQTINHQEIDVLIAGPVTRLGMDDAGTLQQVRDFMLLVAEIRTLSARRLAVVLIHHENKGGAVSGAWEGAGDTLLHVEKRGPGHTRLNIEKARWSSAHHGTGLELVWTDGEGFRVEDGERDYAAEIRTLLSDGTWKTAKEIAAPRDKGGIGASADTIKGTLKERPTVFQERTGDAAVEVGRHPNATVYGLTPPGKSDESDGGFSGGQGSSDSLTLPVGESEESESDPTSDSTPKSHTAAIEIDFAQEPDLHEAAR